MISASNIYVDPLYYNLNSPEHDVLHHSVVQKGDVATRYIYAEQLWNNQADIHVYRAAKETNVPFNSTPVLVMTNTAGGHTQTFEYADISGEWFVGTKPKDGWTTQIARVHVPAGQTYTSNTELPRLSYLNRAGYQQGINYAGSHLTRVEAAVSPDYQYFLIASIDDNNNGYFSAYYLSDINTALTQAGTNDVNIQNITCRKAFVVSNLVGKIGSIQGYDISNNADYIYISSQYSPSHSDISRKIVQIPWGVDDSANWGRVSLDDQTVLDDYNNSGTKYRTELEGIQLIDTNNVWLTVAYHDTDLPNNRTVMNRIYRVSWTSNV